MHVLRINSIYNNPIIIKSDCLKLFNTKSLESIKKIATDNQLNIFINASTNTKRDKDQLTLMAMAIKNNSYTRSAAVLHTDKNISTEELSVKVYNVSVMAIEALNNKIKKLKFGKI